MQLTPAQRTTLRNAINGEPVLAPHLQPGNENHGAIVDYLNGAGTGFVWKPRVTVDEMKSAIDWAAYAALTVQKQNAYLAMTLGGYVDASSASVRTGFGVVFGAGSATVTALTQLAQRTPTRLEQIFRDGNNASPLFGQIASVQGVVEVLNP